MKWNSIHCQCAWNAVDTEQTFAWTERHRFVYCLRIVLEKREKKREHFKVGWCGVSLIIIQWIFKAIPKNSPDSKKSSWFASSILFIYLFIDFGKRMALKLLTMEINSSWNLFIDSSKSRKWFNSINRSHWKQRTTHYIYDWQSRILSSRVNNNYLKKKAKWIYCRANFGSIHTTNFNRCRSQWLMSWLLWYGIHNMKLALLCWISNSQSQ